MDEAQYTKTLRNAPFIQQSHKGGLRRNGGLHVHSSLLNVVLHD